MQKVEIQPKIKFDSNLSSNTAVVRANVNIALIKYWGKRNEDLILPYTSSLSLTLSDLWTTTSVSFDDNLTEDCVNFDGKNLSLDDSSFRRIVNMLDLVRKMAGISKKASVISTNHVPTAAGLASSASGFAALAAASSYAAGLELSSRDLSRLARRGSGSACRSVYGGIVLWHAGSVDTSVDNSSGASSGDETSFAEPVDVPEDFDIAMIAVVLDSSKKSISSRDAMRRTVQTSPSYMPWVEQSAKDLRQALCAVKSSDIEMLGDAVERNSFGMHKSMRDAVPPVDYLTAKTHAVLGVVKSMRDCGWPVWATMDAGPNVKVITSASTAERVLNELVDRVKSEFVKREFAKREFALDTSSSISSSISASEPDFILAFPGSGLIVNRGVKND